MLNVTDRQSRCSNGSMMFARKEAERIDRRLEVCFTHVLPKERGWNSIHRKNRHNWENDKVVATELLIGRQPSLLVHPFAGELIGR